MSQPLPAELRASKDWDVLFFNNPANANKNAPATVGITTSRFGDMSYQDPDYEKIQSKNLTDHLRYESYHKLRVKHGDEVVVLDSPRYSSNFGNYYDCDILIRPIRSAENMLLISNTADCPIIMISETEATNHSGWKSQVQAIAHSGWRGTVANVAAKTVATIYQVTGISPKRLQAYVWPGINGQYYQVGPEVASQLPKYTSGGQLYLAPAIKDQLLDAGLSLDNIIIPDIYSNYSFISVRLFSHRIRKELERNACFIGSRGIM